MPIDASIPMKAGQVGTFNLAEIMRNAEAVKASRQEREYRALQMEEMRAKAKRQGTADLALADLILAEQQLGPQGASPRPAASQTVGHEGEDLAAASPAFDPARPDVPAPTSTDPAQMGPPSLASMVQQPRPPAWENYVRADPKGAMDYRKALAGITQDEFKMTQDLNAGALQILGGVNDQASYEAAKRSAAALYGRYGLNLDDLQLPDEYSPGTINRLRFQAMNTQRQLEQVRADRKLDWDIEDDEADNERLDRNTGSLIADRNARRAEQRRNNTQRDATTRRGQDLRPAPRTNGSAARPTATGPNGQKVEWNGKAWVPAK